MNSACLSSAEAESVHVRVSVNGETGILMPVGDVTSLGRYLDHPDQRHGEAGRRRVEAHFINQFVWAILF